MLEPRTGRVPLIVAFGCASAASVAWYPATKAPTLLLPVLVGALPFAATNAQSGADLRMIAAVFLLVWALLGSLSVGPFYAPAVIAMFVAASMARQTPPGESGAS